MFSILHIAPLIEPLTFRAPGGAEQVVLSLAKHQQRMGLRPRIIAARNSELPGEIELVDLNIDSALFRPARTWEALSPDEALKHSRQVAKEQQAFAPVLRFIDKHRSEISVIHNHAYDYTPLFSLAELGLPVVHTLHLPPYFSWINEALKQHALRAKHVSYVTVSEAMAASYEQVAGVRLSVIHNGVCLNEIPFNADPRGGFLWVGRISPEKGLHTAIAMVVESLNAPLRIAGRIYAPQYFEEKVVPWLNHPLVDYLGHLPHSEVIREMGNARCLLFPIEWDEPFGLVLAESLAAGTPVVATRRGAVSEIVNHGENGFIADSASEFLSCLERVGELSRENCRQSVADRFNIEFSVNQYHREYKRVSLFSQI